MLILIKTYNSLQLFTLSSLSKINHNTLHLHFKLTHDKYSHITNNKQSFVSVFNIFFTMTSSYPHSTVAIHLLNQLLDSLIPVPVSSTSSTFTLPSLPVSSRDAETTTTSTSTLPPISSLISTAVQTFSPPFNRLLLIFLPLLP